MTTQAVVSAPQLGVLVENLIQSSKAEGRLSDEHLLGLHTLLQSICEGALEIIDKGLMTIVEAKPSGRSFFLFEGKKGAKYVCFGHYCSCPSFVYTVLIKSDYCCKHQLASGLVHIANCKRREIRDEDYAAAVSV